MLWGSVSSYKLGKMYSKACFAPGSRGEDQTQFILFLCIKQLFKKKDFMLNDGFLFEVFRIPLAIIRLGFAIATLYVFIYEMESYLMMLAAQLK